MRIVVAISDKIPADIEEQLRPGETVLTYDAEDVTALTQKLVALIEEERNGAAGTTTEAVTAETPANEEGTTSMDPVPEEAPVSP